MAPAPTATLLAYRRVDRILRAHRPSLPDTISRLVQEAVPNLGPGEEVDDEALLGRVRSLLQLGQRVTNWCHYRIGELVKPVGRYCQ